MNLQTNTTLNISIMTGDGTILITARQSDKPVR